MSFGQMVATPPATAKVLLIDDDESFVTLLKEALEQAGYRVEVARNGLEGVRRFFQAQPDLVVLDLTMPEMDGWECCRRIREVSDVPTLMLTARVDEEDEVRSLQEGVDLYITKPIAMPVLLARIQALLRRSNRSSGAVEQAVIAVGDLRIDLGKHRVSRAGRSIRLSPTEFRLLAALATRPGETVSRRELLSRAWGPEYSAETGYLKLYVWYLRRKIEDDPSRPQRVVTVRGAGYYLSDGTL